MKVFVLCSNLPTARARSAEAATLSVVEGLLSAGHEVVFQGFLGNGPTEGSDIETGRGHFEFLPPLPPPVDAQPPSRAGSAVWRARRLLSSDPARFYPSTALRPEVRRRLTASKADVAFVIWSAEGLATGAANGVVPTFLYHGVPDNLAVEARLAAPDLFGIPHRTLLDRLHMAERRLDARHYGHAHIDLVRGCEVAADLCLLHAREWEQAGHPNARYIPNLYPDRGAAEPPAETVGRRLIGNISDPAATGNTFGLAFLVREVLPALRRRGVADYAIDLYGRGVPSPGIATELAQPEIVQHGWVDDLDVAIREAAAFLLFNNAGAYEAAYSRVLHVWSLSGCLIAHPKLTEAMPEVRHGENALLAGTGDEAAGFIAQVLEDDALRMRLGRAGRETYERFFQPAVVVPQLLSALAEAAAA